jgi:hypothetical protein
MIKALNYKLIKGIIHIFKSRVVLTHSLVHDWWDSWVFLFIRLLFCGVQVSENVEKWQSQRGHEIVIFIQVQNENWDQVGKADRHNNPTENRGEQT